MTDESSPIIDFYPTEFVIDLNGKKHAWQGVTLLPFIDEERLLKAMKPIKLSEEDERLNKLGYDLIFVGVENVLFEPICSLYGTRKDKTVTLFSK